MSLLTDSFLPGDIQTAIKIYEEDLLESQSLSYFEVKESRDNWFAYKQPHVSIHPTSHYLAYADHVTTGLHNLRFSARLSQVPLRVLSLSLLASHLFS
jgi:hypothetical protein